MKNQKTYWNEDWQSISTTLSRHQNEQKASFPIGDRGNGTKAMVHRLNFLFYISSCINVSGSDFKLKATNTSIMWYSYVCRHKKFKRHESIYISLFSGGCMAAMS